jgi:hypothetical protein
VDEFEHALWRNLIAIRAVLDDAPSGRRELLTEAAVEAENRLYAYQMLVGSAAMYYTYENNPELNRKET